MVTERTAEPGIYDFTWLSGPNEGYGFMSAASDKSSRTQAKSIKEIREFLAMINPDTGYID